MRFINLFLVSDYVFVSFPFLVLENQFPFNSIFSENKLFNIARSSYLLTNYQLMLFDQSTSEIWCFVMQTFLRWNMRLKHFNNI